MFYFKKYIKGRYIVMGLNKRRSEIIKSIMSLSLCISLLAGETLTFLLKLFLDRKCNKN